MKEIWKDIKGFEGVYQISNLGNVKSLPRKAGTTYLREKILKPRKHTGGYSIVSLGRGYKYKNYFIHRLVAEAFLPNPLGLLEVNHIDENKTNNNVENLEWCDRIYNTNFNGLSYRKWNSRRKKYKYTDLSTGQYKIYENKDSYSEMEKDGFIGWVRACANKSDHGYKYKGGLLEVVD